MQVNKNLPYLIVLQEFKVPLMYSSENIWELEYGLVKPLR